MSQDVDLTTCDREPIHIPGSVQVHGCLLACDMQGQRILRASSNAEAFLGLGHGSPVEKDLHEFLPARAAHDVRNAFANAPDPRRPAVLLGYRLTDKGQLFDIAVHRHNGHAILEFEHAAESAKNPLELARNLIARTQSLISVDQMARQVPRYLQAMLDYDRVMIYRFAVDGSGKVIGEAKRAHLESFLGQHFPAADIPQQARALYLKNTIRVISDAKGLRSPVVPEFDSSGAPLDLSYAHLRSVSPIHLEYLRNMGVAASMSVSIIVNGELWGLIACHHYAPRALSMPQRMAAELFGDFFSLHIAAADHRRRYEATMRARMALDTLMGEMTFHDVVEQYLRDHLQQLQGLVPCDGVGLMLNGTWSAQGIAPPTSAVAGLLKNISPDVQSGVWATHDLSNHFPSAAGYAADVSGMLLVPLSKLPRDYLIFFRREQVQMLEWAGDPNKTYEVGPLGDRLTPRTSFAIWKQSVECQSLPWSEEDRQIAEAVRIGLQDVIFKHSEVLEDERRKAEVRQRVLNEELNHRVKNILALIKSLVTHKPDEKQNLSQYIEALQGRIVALSFAHDQVIRSGGGGFLLQLLKAELSPYASEQIVLSGEDVGLEARAYSVMALALHELATNAAKYGALSTKSGRLSVSWALDEAGNCNLEWRESGGPPVTPPTRSGFGSVLLSRSIPFDLGGTSNLDYRHEGVAAQFMIPGKFVRSAITEGLTLEKADLKSRDAEEVFTGKTALLVEDQFLIAIDAEESLQGMGFNKVVTSASAADALKLLQTLTPDVAVLDVNLGAGTSVPIAEELRRKSIPFIFATGYGDLDAVPEHLKNVGIVRKPYSTESLQAQVAQALQSAK